MNDACAICGESNWSEAYVGPIRDGVFGRQRPGRVLRCGACLVEVLVEPAQPPEEYYSEGAYRSHVGEAPEVEHFFERHDHEQFRQFPLLQHLTVRHKRVADVGCGGGSFLDGLAGYAAETVAIEPARSYYPSLIERGHRVFPDVASASDVCGGRMDLVVCFSVIEHVGDPLSLLRGIHGLLAPGGTALVSTPNRGDILLAAGCEPYRQFFYRVVHKYYFEERSLRRAAERAGFRNCEIVYRHRFGFSNFVGWLTEGRPTGHERSGLLDRRFDSHWCLALEHERRADYLYAYLS
jgi:2-polyprenyl-3-methyl-5-hydroxy-6-metoxy-1,4-benzoquinol methylase